MLEHMATHRWEGLGCDEDQGILIDLGETCLPIRVTACERMMNKGNFVAQKK